MKRDRAAPRKRKGTGAVFAKDRRIQHLPIYEVNLDEYGEKR